MKAVITVIGQDRVGIISALSSILADAGVNILDISQTIMKEVFTMIMLVDISESADSISDLSKKLENKGNEMSLRVQIQRVDIFNSMHKI